MWKLIIGFIVLAAIAIYVLTQGGDIDMTGEKHGAAAPRHGQAFAVTIAG